ncbi:MAG: hypothetical protein HQL87_14550 [Magnetococcales bacterium]|nr:hypothetical protein [Magnetococcales bacterium]
MSKSVTLTACVDPNLDAELNRLAAAYALLECVLNVNIIKLVWTNPADTLPTPMAPLPAARQSGSVAETIRNTMKNTQKNPQTFLSRAFFVRPVLLPLRWLVFSPVRTRLKSPCGRQSADGNNRPHGKGKVRNDAETHHLRHPGAVGAALGRDR